MTFLLSKYFRLFLISSVIIGQQKTYREHTNIIVKMKYLEVTRLVVLMRLVWLGHYHLVYQRDLDPQSVRKQKNVYLKAELDKKQ